MSAPSVAAPVVKIFFVSTVSTRGCFDLISADSSCFDLRSVSISFRHSLPLRIHSRERSFCLQADESVTDKASDAMRVPTDDAWFIQIKRSYRVVSLGHRGPDEVNTRAHGALGYGDAPMSTGVSAGALVATTAHAFGGESTTTASEDASYHCQGYIGAATQGHVTHVSQVLDALRATFGELEDITLSNANPAPCSMEDLMPFDDTLTHGTFAATLGPVAPTPSVATHPTTVDASGPDAPSVVATKRPVSPAIPPVAEQAQLCDMAFETDPPVSAAATRHDKLQVFATPVFDTVTGKRRAFQADPVALHEEQTFEEQTFIANDGNAYKNTDVQKFFNQYLDLAASRSSSPCEIMNPLVHPALSAKKRRRRDLSDSFNAANAAKNIGIDKMPELANKLKHVNMTIDNVRIDKDGKVKGVNYNASIRKYDVRYVKQLPNTDSKGRTALNVYAKAYESIDDATVAVVLLEAKLKAISDDGFNTRFDQLKMITDKGHRRQKITELGNQIEQEVNNMNNAMQLERNNMPVADVLLGSDENANLPVVTLEIDWAEMAAQYCASVNNILQDEANIRDAVVQNAKRCIEASLSH